MSSPASPRPPRSQAQSRLVFGAAVAATAVFAAWLRWDVGGAKTALYFSDAGTVLAPMLASVACFRAGRWNERKRAFWWLLGAACASWMLGEMIWAGYDLAGADGPPVPSVADIGYLAFIPLAVAALRFHPGMPRGGTRRARSLLDGLSIAVALFFLSWTAVLGPLWRKSHLSSLGGIVTFAYPLGDVAIGFCVLVALRRIRTSDRLALASLLVGLAALALGDSTYAYVVEVHGYTAGNTLDTGWFAGFLAIALGAYASIGHNPVVESDAALPPLAALVAPLLPMLVALGVAAITLQRAMHPDRVAVALVVALVGLAFVRQALLVRDIVASHRGGWGGNVLETLVGAVLAGEAPAEPGDAPQGQA